MDNFDNSHNPVPVILSILTGIAKSDEIVQIIQESGISIDLSLSPKDDFSNLTRIRAYIPRIEKVFRATESSEALHTLTVTSGTIIQNYPEKETEIREKLNRIGWDYSNKEILPASNNVTELYFSKGLEHSAYIEIRNIISSTESEIAIIDQWIDKTLFELIKTLNTTTTYKVRIITKEKRNDDFIHEMELFMKQYSNIAITIHYSNYFHDRFIIINNKELYHLGASIKDAGKKAFIISKIETISIINDIIREVKKIIEE